MPISYVLVNSEYGSDELIIDELKSSIGSESGVELEVQGVYGIYDIILKLTADDAARLRSIITNIVRRIPKVQSTLTMMVIDEQDAS